MTSISESTGPGKGFSSGPTQSLNSADERTIVPGFGGAEDGAEWASNVSQDLNRARLESLWKEGRLAAVAEDAADRFGFVVRRLRRFEAARNRLQKDMSTPPLCPSDGEIFDRSERRGEMYSAGQLRTIRGIERLSEDMSYWSGFLEKLLEDRRVMIYSSDVIHKGDEITYDRKLWHEVLRVNNKSVTIRDPGVLNRTTTVAYSRILELRNNNLELQNDNFEDR